MTVAALYRNHRWLTRGLYVAFLCEVVWLVCVWSLLFPRSGALDDACNAADLANVKWCFIAVAFVPLPLVPQNTDGMVDRAPAFFLDSFILLLTVRKVFELSRVSSRIPLLQLLLCDAVWAFALIWGWSSAPSRDSVAHLLSHFAQ
jgi:hypothetical protein